MYCELIFHGIPQRLTDASTPWNQHYCVIWVVSISIGDVIISFWARWILLDWWQGCVGLLPRKSQGPIGNSDVPAKAWSNILPNVYGPRPFNDTSASGRLPLFPTLRSIQIGWLVLAWKQSLRMGGSILQALMAHNSAPNDFLTRAVELLRVSSFLLEHLACPVISLIVKAESVEVLNSPNGYATDKIREYW